MDKKGNKRFGFYGGQMEVQDKIEELKNEGYPSDNIYVIAKDNEQINGLRSNSEVHFSTEQDGDWIDKFKEMFSGNHSLKNVFEEMGFTRDESEEYNQRIENGEIFLFADDEEFAESAFRTESSTSDSTFDRESNLAQPESVEDTYTSGNEHGQSGNQTEPPMMSRKERRKNLSAGGEDSIFLHEEQLEVHKERVQTGEVNVNKRIVEEQQQMDVPVERDDVIVERRPIADNGIQDEEIRRDPYQVGDELHIPVIEERLVVTKKEVVTEEIVVTRRRIQDTEHVSETIRREEVDIDENDLSNGRRTE